jgi:hypothetical protein
MVDNNDDNYNKIEQTLLDLLAKSLKTIIAGAIDINMEGKAALRVRRLITRSDDIQIDSVRESIKLSRDLKNKEE